ncbi:MAG: hypothetical protein RL308_82 [Bacteroidota bacterium]|jgi:hypothetical protein
MTKSTKTLDQLRQKLSGLNLFGPDALYQIEYALSQVKTAMEDIEADVALEGFNSSKDEIFFFRHVKPHVFAMHIFYTKLRKLELFRLSCNKKKFRGLVEKKLNFIQEHYLDYPEFTRYYNSSSTHDDECYFLRSSSIKLDCSSLFYNHKLSTGYDVLAAYLLAYQFLIEHFDQNDKKVPIDSSISTFSWSFKKVDFVELISGLHAIASVNKGEIDIKTLCVQLAPIFNIEIKDVYGKRNEIKERKGERFKFIRQMLDNLEREFDDNFE